MYFYIVNTVGWTIFRKKKVAYKYTVYYDTSKFLKTIQMSINITKRAEILKIVRLYFIKS